MIRPQKRLYDAAEIYILENIVKKNYRYSWIQALVSAGYSDSYAKNNSVKMWNSAITQDKLAHYYAKNTDKVIKEKKERQRFWADTLQNSEYHITDRLQASALLGKSEGDFIEKIQHEFPGVVPPDQNALERREKRMLNAPESPAVEINTVPQTVNAEAVMVPVDGEIVNE